MALDAFGDVVREAYQPLPRYRGVAWSFQGHGDRVLIQKGRLKYHIDFNLTRSREDFVREIDKALNYVTEPEPIRVQHWLDLSCP